MKNYTRVMSIASMFFIISNYTTFSHDQDVHKYITWHAWELVKWYHPEVQYSEMNSHIGGWQDGSLNGQVPWQTKKVITGAYREDEEDVVYNYGGLLEGWNATNTHFWDGYDGSSFHPPPYIIFYPNSYKKTLAYWNGIPTYDNPEMINNDFLRTNWFYIVGTQTWRFRIHYTNLADFYKNTGTQAYMSGYIPTGANNWFDINPPEPINWWLYPWEITVLRDRFIWEEVGRMCHLFEDAGCPAHTHYDPHPTDVYEKNYMAPSNHGGSNHYLDYSWTNARDDGGLIDISNKTYKLRYLLYTTLAIARRFPSNDYWGINQFDASYNGDDYSSILQPIFNVINNLQPPVPVNPGVSTLTAGRIARYAYVYNIRAVASFLWYIYQQFNINSNPPPVISGFTQIPGNIGPQVTGTVKANLSQGQYVSFYWVSDYRPSYITDNANSSNHSNTVTITNHFSSLDNKPKNSKEVFMPTNSYALRCTAINSYGTSVEKTWLVMYSTNSGGCPWVYVMTDSNVYTQDNNILHKSEIENAGMDITDKYKLREAPLVSNGKLSLKILETDYDHSQLDKVTLQAIDHPIGTRLGITEYNQIVTYDSVPVLSTDNAILDKVDVTEEIQFHYSQKRALVVGDTLSHLYAHYPNNIYISAGIITELEGDRIITPTVKDYAGVLSASTSNGLYQSPFTRRERKSEIILPIYTSGLFGTQIYDLNIDYLRDFKLRYVALTELSYTNYISSDIILYSAINSDDIDVTYQLSEIDNTYAELDTGKYVILNFFNQNQGIPPGSIRDYVLESVGSYTNNSSKRPSQIIINSKQKPTIKSLHYKLYANYPNPFNPKTVIQFEIPNPGFVELNIYNSIGQLVQSLIKKELTAGLYDVEFNGMNFPSGIYFYQIRSGNFSETKKMVLIK